MIIGIGVVLMAVGFAVYGVGLAVECIKAMIAYKKGDEDVLDITDDDEE